MAKDISSYDDVIDVRDVIARVEELEADVLVDTAGDNDADDNRDDLAALTSLMEELQGNGGDEKWRGAWYPVTLIRDSYTKDYAQEFAEDIGAVNSDMAWPGNCIDWEQATYEFLMDYASVEFGGVTYWYR